LKASIFLKFFQRVWVELFFIYYNIATDNKTSLPYPGQQSSGQRRHADFYRYERTGAAHLEENPWI